MIRINRKTDYAIRVLLALVKQGENALLPTSQIQQQMLIPKLLSSRVVAELAQGEFVVTFSGRDGGVKIARQASEINLRQVVEHFENNFSVSDCIRGDKSYPFEQNCPVSRKWAHLQAMIRASWKALLSMS